MEAKKSTGPAAEEIQPIVAISGDGEGLIDSLLDQQHERTDPEPKKTRLKANFPTVPVGQKQDVSESEPPLAPEQVAAMKRTDRK